MHGRLYKYHEDIYLVPVEDNSTVAKISSEHSYFPTHSHSASSSLQGSQLWLFSAYQPGPMNLLCFWSLNLFCLLSQIGSFFLSFNLWNPLLQSWLLPIVSLGLSWNGQPLPMSADSLGSHLSRCLQYSSFPKISTLLHFLSITPSCSPCTILH